jgi:ankyrin repeat protein
MKLLIDNHCDLNVSSSKGRTALIWVAFNGHLECVKLLIENHCDVNVSNNNRDAALLFASLIAI